MSAIRSTRTKITAFLAVLALAGTSSVAVADEQAPDVDAVVAEEQLLVDDASGTAGSNPADLVVDEATPDVEGVDESEGELELAATNVVPDKALRVCLNSYLGYESGDARAITAAQLKTITEAVSCTPNSSLEGLQYLTNATSLALKDLLPTTTLAPLEKLKSTKMTRLSLEGDVTKSKKAVKFPNLSGLSELAEISVISIAFSDISNIAKNRKLTYVAFSNAELTNVDVLAKLPNVQSLDLTGNNIKDVSALANIPTLKVLGVRQNQLTSVPKRTAINPGNPNSKPRLEISGNKIKNFANLQTWETFSYVNQNQKLVHLDQSQNISLPLVVSNGKTVVDVSSLRSPDGSLPLKAYRAERFGSFLEAYPGSVSNGGKTVTFSQVLKDGDWIYCEGSGFASWYIQLKIVKVSSVSVSGASSVKVGASVSLTATVSPSNATNKAVSWKSSDTSVATVNSEGKVTGKKAGSVTITATAKDGSKKSASKKVSVVQLVTKVSVSGASKVAVGNLVRLNVFVGPSNASNKALSWKSSNTAVATVDANGMVTTKKPGTVTITATAKDGSKKSGSVKISVLKQSFKDVPISHQFYSDVEWLAAKKITTGWSDKTFRPSEPVTRAAFAAFLYRMAGSPKYMVPVKSTFKDVPTTHQFYKEISWAASKGITKGWADGTFRPEAKIQRDAIAAFLYRFAGQPKFTVSKSFKDVKASEHRRAIEWLASKGISTGWSDGTFRPAQPTERGAIAAFLHRYATKKIPIAVK